MGKIIDRLFQNYRSINVHKLTEAIAIGIFGIGAITAYALASVAYNTSSVRYSEALDRQASAMRSHINFEYTQYEQILKTAAAFSNLTEQDMNREMWREYVQRGAIIEDHPAMLGIGYVDVFDRTERTEYIEALDSEYAGTVNIEPTELREFYTSISYLEPLNVVNRRAIGYDMYSDPARRAAMERARDQHTVALSAPVKLVQDGQVDNAYGVLMYFPVYAGGVKPDTLQERREALDAYVYIVVRPADVARLLDRNTVGDTVDFVLRDGATILYSSINESGNSETRQVNHDMYGRSWVISSRVDRNLIGYWSGAVLIMLFGVVLSGILAVIVYRLLSRRIAYLEEEHDESIAATKNELVMLASHQLRTPASGVKQYLGMLTEGLVGELGHVEREVVQKAYNSNERQIKTIDQILHVAKADAGQLLLNYQRFDLVSLVADIIEESTEAADKKQITVKQSGSLTLPVSADKHYVTMALENLLSNAIKYSYNSSIITVVIKGTTQFASVEVQDEGVGVDANRADQIFEKFVRLDNPLSVEEGGTGLGLFLAKQIALAHGGTIELSNNKPSGSIFTLTIPRKKTPRKARKLSKQ